MSPQQSFDLTEPLTPTAVFHQSDHLLAVALTVKRETITPLGWRNEPAFFVILRAPGDRLPPRWERWADAIIVLFDCRDGVEAGDLSIEMLTGLLVKSFHRRHGRRAP